MACSGSSCLVLSSSPSPAPRRSTPTWAISAQPYSNSLDGFRASGAHLELSWPGRSRPVESGGGGKSVLSARAAMGPLAARHPRHDRHGHCEPGRHHRRIFPGPPSNPAWAFAAHARPAHIGDAGRPDLHSKGQSASLARGLAARSLVQELQRLGVSLWNRRDRNDGGHHLARFVVVWKLWRWPIWLAALFVSAFSRSISLFSPQIS